MRMKAAKKVILLIVITLLQLLFFHYLYRFIFNIYPHNITLIHSSQDETNKKSLHNLIMSQLINDKTITRDNDKCYAYFDKLQFLNPNYTSIEKAIAQWHYETDLDTSSNHLYFEKQYNKLKQEWKNDNRDIKDINSKDVLNQVNQQILINNIVKYHLIDSIGSLRIYNHCDNSFNHDQCLELDLKLFPWFSFESPIFKRWDGTVLKKFPHIQIFANGPKIAVNEQESTGSKSCFWSKFQKNYNGDGIVIPVGSFEDMNNALKMIKVLRFQRNTLPIQIIYNKDIYELPQDLIDSYTAVARDVVIFENGEELKALKQEIWFVDVNNVITEEYKKLNRETLKTLAIIFNSFTNAIVISADSIPMVFLQDLLSKPEFIENGLFLFKSRQSNQKLAQNYFKLINSIYPSNLEISNFPDSGSISPSQNKYMDLKNPQFISDTRLLIINKSRSKLFGLLTSLHLQQTTDIHTNELIWLGQSLNDNPYHLNDLQPGAIGQVSTDSMDHKSIASKQLAHFYDRELIWISDGFYQCGEPVLRNEFDILSSDVSKPPVFQDVQDDDQLKKKYQELIPLQNVIIPPETPLTLSNAWERTRYCNDKIYKVYNDITLQDEDGIDLETVKGKFMKFPVDVVHLYTSIQEVWSLPCKTLKLGSSNDV